MSDSPQNINSPLFTNPLETFPGLSIDDLNKYLPAIRTVEDMSFSIDRMEEGLFLAKCLDGLKQIPDNSIDLIIADPPEDPLEFRGRNRSTENTTGILPVEQSLVGRILSRSEKYRCDLSIFTMAIFRDVSWIVE